MKLKITLSLILSVLAMCGTAHACSVPVFRYALENWQADPYVVSVFHRGPLTAEQQEWLSVLQPVNEDGYHAANIFLRTVDLNDDLGEATAAVWSRHQSDELPHVVVQVPGKFGAPATDVWTGALNEENVTALIGSPVRKEIEKRLLEGTSVVWVFLESGDSEKDDAAYELLTAELQRLQSLLQLPEIDPADFAELSVAPEALKLEFSALRVARDDPDERMLVEMLLSVESDLRDEQYVNEPMAFPVFGRGRALYALLGNGIQPATIENASRFLVGECTCTVKAQNDGMDLLMAVDWERYVEPALAMETALPPLSGLGGFVSDDAGKPEETETAAGDSAEETVKPFEPVPPDTSEDVPDVPQEEDVEIPAEPDVRAPVVSTDAPDSPPQSQDSGVMRNTMLVIGLVLAGVLIATLLVMRRP